jgi:flagellar protein FliT
MDKQHEYLQQLLDVSEQILDKAKAISPKMDDNDAEDLVEVQGLFDKRQTVIDQLEFLRKDAAFVWSPEGKAMAAKLQATEQQLQPLMKGLQQAFIGQMNRINQTKQMSQKYRNSYQTNTTDGTFFDARK